MQTWILAASWLAQAANSYKNIYFMDLFAGSHNHCQIITDILGSAVQMSLGWKLNMYIWVHYISYIISDETRAFSTSCVSILHGQKHLARKKQQFVVVLGRKGIGCHNKSSLLWSKIDTKSWDLKIGYTCWGYFVTPCIALLPRCQSTDATRNSFLVAMFQKEEIKM